MKLCVKSQSISHELDALEARARARLKLLRLGKTGRKAVGQEKRLKKRRAYYQKNKDKLKAMALMHYAAHRGKILARQRKRQKENADLMRACGMVSYYKYRTQRLKRMSNYKQMNRDKMNAYRREKMRSDQNYYWAEKTRRFFWHTLRGKYRDEPVEKRFGCGVLDLIDHISSLFTKGMGWGNYGKWEIDHKIPCCAFDCSDEKQRAACWHYSNLRPVWAKENRLKNRSIPDGFNASDYTAKFHAI